MEEVQIGDIIAKDDRGGYTYTVASIEGDKLFVTSNGHTHNPDTTPRQWHGAYVKIVN